jgi:hypothetical protein
VLGLPQVCKGIPKDSNKLNYQKLRNVLFNGREDKALGKGFRYVNGTMKSYEPVKKGLRTVHHGKIDKPD